MITDEIEGIEIPPDIQEFGARHKIPEFANATYRNGYLAGRRAALAALPDLLSAARTEGVDVAIAAVDRWILYIDDVSYRVVMNALQAARISSLNPKTTDEAKP